MRPEAGDVIRGQMMTAELLATLEPDEFPTEYFQPTGYDIAVAVALVAAGFAVTALVARLGGERHPRPALRERPRP